MRGRSLPPVEVDTGRALRLRPVLAAWLMAVGVDVLFNAGLFSALFDQNREPSLLPDAVLFRRIPVAYVALAIAVSGLAWLLDRTDRRGAWAAATAGAWAGLVVAGMGIVTLWTAIDLTGLFVAAGAVVQVGELATSGAVLGAFRAAVDQRRLTRRVFTLALLAAAAGILAQNLMSPGP